MYKFVCDPEALFNMTYGSGENNRAVTNLSKGTTNTNNSNITNLNAQEQNTSQYYGNNMTH